MRYADRGLYSEALKVAEENIDDPVALEDRIRVKKNEIDATLQAVQRGAQEQTHSGS